MLHLAWFTMSAKRLLHRTGGRRLAAGIRCERLGTYRPPGVGRAWGQIRGGGFSGTDWVLF